MHTGEKKLVQQIILLFLVIIAFAILVFSLRGRLFPQDSYKTHTSQDLRISFAYPNAWYVDEKARDILVASYRTEIGENSFPENGNTKIVIDEFSICGESLDEEVRESTCVNQQSKPNEILEKDTWEVDSGKMTKYTLRTSSGNEQVLYYLQDKHSNRVVQISKIPDLSDHEKEFDEIISSILFL